MKLATLVARAKIDKVPRGWLDREQLAKAEGFSSATSFWPTLRRAIALDLVEVKEFRVLWGGKQVRPRPHYRRVKSAR